MRPRSIKWMIFLLPTLSIGAWEFIRHEYLIHHLSMTAGNWLAPVIVLAVTLTAVWPLFILLERTQEALNREKLEKAALIQREKMARELHDGIAQSLFLLSVKVNQLEPGRNDGRQSQTIQGLHRTLYEMDAYVRQAIASLRTPSETSVPPWTDSLRLLVEQLERETGIDVDVDWTLQEDAFTSQEKVELYASVREALVNVRKHARASRVWIRALQTEHGWTCEIEDDGIGLTEEAAFRTDRFGLRIMQERCREMGWNWNATRTNERTVVRIGKEEIH